MRIVKIVLWSLVFVAVPGLAMAAEPSYPAEMLLQSTKDAVASGDPEARE